MIRVLPHNAARPPQDAAELANPPYGSPTPILLSTSRAQDAIVWNPRCFRFFTRLAQVAAAEAAYQATLREPNRPAAGDALYPLLAQAAEATFTIVDAEIAGSTANQTQTAAAVASHMEQTAHRVRAPIFRRRRSAQFFTFASGWWFRPISSAGESIPYRRNTQRIWRVGQLGPPRQSELWVRKRSLLGFG